MAVGAASSFIVFKNSDDNQYVEHEGARLKNRRRWIYIYRVVDRESNENNGVVVERGPLNTVRKTGRIRGKAGEEAGDIYRHDTDGGTFQ